MGDRNRAHRQEAPSSYLQGKTSHSGRLRRPNCTKLYHCNKSVHGAMICFYSALSRMASVDPLSLFLCFCRSQHSRCPRGGSARPPAHAFRQHAAGGGRGRTRERWRVCSCCSCSRSLRRGRRQLHWTFRLQSQTHPDQTDLPHRAGEIWTGK